MPVPPLFCAGTPTGLFGQQNPVHGLGLRGCFLLTSAQGQLLFSEYVVNSWFRSWACWRPGCLSDGVEPPLLQGALTPDMLCVESLGRQGRPLCCARQQGWMAPIVTQTLILWLRKWGRRRNHSFERVPTDLLIPTDPLIPRSHL